MPRHFSRDDWGAKPPRDRVILSRSLVEGLALHWPAITTPLGNPERVMSALRAIQAAHMNTDQIAKGGASDIAYQVAIDQQGNSYRLRGLRFRSAANGSREVNEAFGAVLLVLADGEQPTPEMVKAVRGRVARFRTIFPNGRDLVGHGDIRPGGTECPGPAVRRLLAAGRFEPRGAR